MLDEHVEQGLEAVQQPQSMLGFKEDELVTERVSWTYVSLFIWAYVGMLVCPYVRMPA